MSLIKLIIVFKVSPLTSPVFSLFRVLFVKVGENSEEEVESSLRDDASRLLAWEELDPTLFTFGMREYIAEMVSF